MLTPKHTRIYPKQGTRCCPNSITGSKLGNPYNFSQGFFILKGKRNPFFLRCATNLRQSGDRLLGQSALPTVLGQNNAFSLIRGQRGRLTAEAGRDGGVAGLALQRARGAGRGLVVRVVAVEGHQLPVGAVDGLGELQR